ncbi:hypothetical protein MPSEU_000290200 [Mayamaea pseudoterrestris]|nr:hypothetical protein MPSEU_000290200 [Mayamaea pseudoterrestris]
MRTRRNRLTVLGAAAFCAVSLSEAFSPNVHEHARASTQRPVSASASSNEYSSSKSSSNRSAKHAATQASAYLNSISNALTEQDLEQIQVEQRIKYIQQQRNMDKAFSVTIPLRETGMSIVQILPGRQLVPKLLHLDALDQIVSLDAAACQKIQAASWMNQIDDSFRGLVFTAVSKNFLAEEQGIKAGTILKAVSATLGDAVWPKSTLEGVQAALASRQVASSQVTLLCSNQAFATSNRYELSLTKPIGLLLQEKDGHVYVTKVTDQASTLVKYAVQSGDRVVAVDSSLGGKLWPVSTVEGVVSACTSRLPGQGIRMILERPLENMNMEAAATADAELTRGSAKASASLAHTPTDTKQLLRRCREVLKRYSSTKGSKLDKYNLPAMIADKVMDALASASATLDAVTLSMIMTAYTSCDQSGQAIKAFESATGFAADGSTSEPVDIMHGREGRTLVPSDTALNLYTATALLQAHANNKDLASVTRVLAALEGRSDVDVDGIMSAPWPWTGESGTIQPDTTCYNIAIAAAEKIGGPLALDAALEIFARMGQGRSNAKDLVSYNTIMGIMSKAGEGEKAFDMFAQLKRDNIQPDKYTYTLLLKVCSQDEDIDEILYDMWEHGVQADVVVYNTALQRLCDNRKFTQATKLVTEMESRGVKPDSVTYGMLMSAMLKAKKANACLALFESASANPRTAALTESVYLYTTAITAAATLGAYERALELVARMSANGIAPNLKTLTAVMGACLASNQPLLASQIYRRIVTPDGYAMTQGIRALCAAGEVTEAADLVQSQEGDLVMSGKQVMQSYAIVLEAALQSNSFTVAQKLVHNFLHKGFIFNKTMMAQISESMLSDVDAIDTDKFSFCLFIIDALRDRNLPIDGSLYSTALSLGDRLGGLHRRLAALIAQSKSAAGTKAQRFLSTVQDASGGAMRVVHLRDLLAEPHLLKGDIVLPPLPVRVGPADIRSVFQAEQLVWSKTKRRKVLV